MHADREVPVARAPRARVGSPSLFEPNLSAQQASSILPPPPPRRESIYSNSNDSNSYVSSDARDRNGSISSVCSNLSEFVNRRGSNDSVFSFTNRDSFSERAGGESKETHNNVFRKRKPRSLRNSFESLQLALASDREESLSVLSLPLTPPPPPPLASSISNPLKFDPLSVCTLTSQLPEEYQNLGPCEDDAECSCCESEDEASSLQQQQPPQQFSQQHHPYWKEQNLEGEIGGCGFGYTNSEHQYFSGLLSPISEGSSSASLSDFTSPLSSPLPSPAELSQHLWQGLLASSIMSPVQPRRVRRAYKKRTQGCNCEKSKCLKLYCECFAKQAVCGPECNCKGCMNTSTELESRERAIQVSLDRSTTAFFRSPETKLEPKGCRCKKSQCRKNYCECFSASRSCTPECRCSDCGNVHGAKLPQLRRLSSGGYEVIAGTEFRGEQSGEGQPITNVLALPSASSSSSSSHHLPPPPPPLSSSRRGPPPPPPTVFTQAKRSPPPPPPPLSLSSNPNVSSLVVSKYRKDVSRRADDLLSRDLSMFWPSSSTGAEGQEEEELQSPFGGFLPGPDDWSKGEDLSETWQGLQSPRDFLSEDSVEEREKASFTCPELQQGSLIKEDCFCPDLLMDVLAASPSSR